MNLKSKQAMCKAAVSISGVMLLGFLGAAQQVQPFNPRGRILDVRLRAQEMRNWCWAACGQMVMEHSNKSVRQCLQALERFGQCDIDRTGWPEFDKYGFSYTTKKAPIPWETLKSEIDKNRPFCFTKRWLGGGAHMVVVKGYSVVGGEKYIHLADPWPVGVGDDSTVMPYDDYFHGSDASPAYEHGSAYYEIQRQNPR